MKNVWMVSRVFPPDEGGVQTYSRAVALAYARQGWNVVVFTKTSAGPRRIDDQGLDIVDVGGGSKAHVYLKLALALLRALRRGPRPDVVHACTWRSGLVPWLLRLRPLSVSVHGREIGRPRGLNFLLMRAVLTHAARVIAVSHWTRRHLLARLPQLEANCFTAWNGLSDLASAPTKAHAESGAEARVLSVCRLVPRKNLRVAIAAAGRCAQRGLKFRYLIAGRGPEMAAMQADIDALNLGGLIQMLGYVSDEELAQLHADADIFLHPQVSLEDGDEMEGFGITIADAMAFGSACIVGVEGGPAELGVSGETSLLVDGHDLDAVTEALATLIADAAQRARMGNAARAWALSQLCWEQHARRVLGA